jgi:hypothetical protein
VVQGARAKFILRKLASAVVPAGSVDRESFIRHRLHLSSVPTAENKWTKTDAVAILRAVVDHVPEAACIPTQLRTRVARD